jgi:hypothetical protein
MPVLVEPWRVRGAVSVAHLRRMTDSFGMVQFSRGRDPDPATGYTADDNARALVVAARLGLEDLAERYLRFLEHSLKPDGWFHNVWGADRAPAPDGRSEDCQGRCLWALGEVVRSDLPARLRRRAERVLRAALPTAAGLVTARGRANALLGLVRLEDASPMVQVAEALCGQLEATDPGWPWPEPVLTYELARVPHGLLRASRSGPERWRRAALRTLDFLLEVVLEDGVAVPVGNRGWYPRGGQKARWDQQPVDAGALVEACVEAYRQTELARYRQAAQAAWEWFWGRNLVGSVMVDPDGACRDGLGPDGPSENRGAEACLAYLLAALAWSDLEG